MTSSEAALARVCAAVAPVEPGWRTRAQARLDSLTKPPGSLGRLEDLAIRIAAVQGTVRPEVARKRIVLMAADHGVVAEGVSPYPQDVTRQMVENFVRGGAAINQLAESVGAELELIDVGVAADLSDRAGLVHSKVASGTANLAVGPAMTREQVVTALLAGIDAAKRAKADGISLLATGEMGIGNTTSAAALTCAFTGEDPADVTGRGTGLDDAGLAHKVDVIRRALVANAEAVGAAGDEPLGVLAALGGLEIAGLAGVVIGAAHERITVVVDGFISGAAALAAVRMCPAAADYVLPSHLSVEPGHRVVLRALALEPVLELDMRLGEGSGAAVAMGIADAACRMISGMATFEEAGVSTADSAGGVQGDGEASESRS